MKTKSRLALALWCLVALGFAAVALRAIERFWLHGPEETVSVVVESELRGSWRKQTEQGAERLPFQYLVRMPDGAKESMVFPFQLRPGTEVAVTIRRGRVTGRIHVVSFAYPGDPE